MSEETYSWTAWLASETHCKFLQIELEEVQRSHEAISIDLAAWKQIAANSTQLLDAAHEQLKEKDKQIDFLNSLVAVRDQEIAQLRQLIKETEKPS